MTVDKDLIHFCVDSALKSGASYSEARLVSTTEEGYILKNGTPESSVFAESSGIGIRVIVDGALGFLAINKLDKKEIASKVKEVIKIAKVSSRSLKVPIKLSKEKAYKDNWEVKAKIKFEDVSPEEKMKYLFDIEKNLSEIKNKLPSRFFQLATANTEKYYVNSDGAEIQAKLPQIFMYYSIIAMENGDTEQRYYPLGESGGWEILERRNLIGKIKEETTALLKILKQAKKLPKENIDVLLSPELVGIAMHESCGHPGEADRSLGREGAQAGETYLTKEWLGKRIGSDVVTVVDDPTLENSYGFYEYDDEGVKAQRRVLIKNGIINDFLHNRWTASVFGKKSNGAARAGRFDREPIVRMSTTFMLPGDFSFEELIEDIKKGVFIKSYTEWNIDDKRWNAKYVGNEAYLIENGELKHLVRRPVLEITTQSFYSSVDALGKKVEFISGTCGKNEPMDPAPVWMGGPFARLRKIPIGSA
ncbi:MAG: TldD/PmbA family protein [Candidatus Aenigmarchaeota archaeon]|nr:TldD/PmbA family protein [Candidatus Aenigmarchaeota archaeon]